MKIDWNRKYTTIAVYSFLLAVAVIGFYLIASQVSIFKVSVKTFLALFKPFIRGFAIAYILNFVMKIYEEKLLSKIKIEKFTKKGRRITSLLMTVATIAFAIYLAIAFVVPQFTESIVTLVAETPNYVKKTGLWLEQIQSHSVINDNIKELIAQKIIELNELFLKTVNDVIPVIANFFKGLVSSVFNTVIALIVAFYYLYAKEDFSATWKKIMNTFFNDRTCNGIIKYFKRTDKIFGKFLTGKLLDSLIVGVIMFITASIFKMPYAILISVVVGVTNIIPYFGPFIGAIPSCLIVLLVSPVKALTLAIIILVIQQIDGNIIGPKILGSSMGLSAFSILFSLTVFTGIFGFSGMIIGVPLYGVLHSVFKEFLDYRLTKKGKPLALESYINESIPKGEQ